MENKYEFTPGNYKKSSGKNRQNKRPQSVFLYLWGPLLIKWCISLVVTILAIFVIETLLLMKKSGVDFSVSNAMEQFSNFLNTYFATSDSQNTQELANEMYQHLEAYTTPLEGFEALITIPVIGIMYFRDQIRKKLQGIAANRKAPLWQYAAIIVMMMALTLGFNNLVAISGMADSDETFTEVIGSLYQASFGMQILCLGILVPICEELVFRGMMFGRDRIRTKSFVRAAIYSAFVFALFHTGLLEMTYAFLMGLVLAYFYEKYGSLAAPVLGHMTANISSIFITKYDLLNYLLKDQMKISIITVLCGTVAATMFVLIRRIDETPDPDQDVVIQTGDKSGTEMFHYVNEVWDDDEAEDKDEAGKSNEAENNDTVGNDDEANE